MDVFFTIIPPLGRGGIILCGIALQTPGTGDYALEFTLKNEREKSPRLFHSLK
jgi:hypothetical protein